MLYTIKKKTNQKKPQKTHLKWKLSLWLNHIHKWAIEEGWLRRTSYVYNHQFISWDCNPCKREEEKNKSLDISASAGSLSLQKWHYLSLPPQDLCPEPKPYKWASLSYTILILWTPTVSCFAVNSCLEKQNSGQVAYKKSTDFSKMLQLKQKTLFNWFWGLLLSLCNRDLSNDKKDLSNYITAVRRTQ